MEHCLAKFGCCLLALSLATPAHAVAPAETSADAAPASSKVPATKHPRDPAALARDAYSEGLRLVQAGEYSAAQAAFARAHALAPHPLSLYNIGQCQARLGQHAAAVQTLEAFLAQAGDTIDPAQRSAVTRQIGELRARVPASGPIVPANVPAPPPAAVSDTGRALVLPPPSSSTMAASESASPWGWVLGGAGVALLGSAAALYLWNDGRYGSWRTDRDQLESIANREQLAQQDARVWDATQSSNERLASIQRVDTVSAITAGVGAAALGLGIWRLLAADDSADATRQTAASPFGWRMQW